MANEIWIPSLPNEIYRVNNLTGAVIGKFTGVPHGGVIISNGDDENVVPDGPSYRRINSSGDTIGTATAADTKGHTFNHRPNRDRHQVYRIPAGPSGQAEFWSYDGASGHCVRFTVAGAYLGQLQLPAGEMLVYVSGEFS